LPDRKGHPAKLDNHLRRRRQAGNDQRARLNTGSGPRAAPGLVIVARKAAIGSMPGGTKDRQAAVGSHFPTTEIWVRSTGIPASKSSECIWLFPPLYTVNKPEGQSKSRCTKFPPTLLTE
jgi:hypothetical protein